MRASDCISTRCSHYQERVESILIFLAVLRIKHIGAG